MLRGLSAFILVLATSAPALAQTSSQDVNLDALPMPVASLQALDKITARVTRLQAPVGETIAFGSLRITPRVCYRTPPEEPPESAAFLEIEEVEPGQPTITHFSGWMFASSPAVSAMDHAIYDVRVLACQEEIKDSGAAEGAEADQN